MAITSFKDVRRQVDNVYHYIIKENEVIPEGALVGIDANGLAINAIADSKVIGVCEGQDDDVNGTLMVRVWTHGIITVKTNAAITQADIGKQVKAVDNETVAIASDGDVVIGELTAMIDANNARMRVLVKK